MVLGVDEKIIDRMMHTESRYIYSDISRHIYPHFFFGASLFILRVCTVLIV
jgi:hypothetical protein